MDDVIAPDPNEVYGSDVEDFSDESRDSLFSIASRPSLRGLDNVVEALFERATAQSLAATDGSARGSSFSGRSVSSASTTPNHDDNSNPQLLYPVHIPVLQELNTLLSSNTPMSNSGAEAISSDEDNDEQLRTWHRLGEETKMKRKLGSAEKSSAAKRNCDGASGSREGPKKRATERDEEEEERVAECAVCLQPIDEGGEHRLVALKCGHPFGEKCVKKWLGSMKQCCPLCNRSAKLEDIRVVFLDCCRLGSSYDLAEAQRQASDYQTELSEQKRLVCELRAENGRLTDRLRFLERGLTARHNQLMLPQTSGKTSFPSEHFFTRFTGSCKYMAYAENMNLLAVSMKAPPGLFEGHGITFCSLYDINSRRQYKIIHRQEIKDLCFHPTRQWLLTASLDNTARISDVNGLSLNSVTSIQLETKVWSCCWSQRNETNFFLGLANGDINEYDVRQPSAPIHQLRSQNRLPVASVKAFEIESLGTRVSGIISPHMRTSVRLYKEDPQNEMGYTAQDIPVPGFCCSLFYEKSSSSILVSTRASNQVMNEIWKLSIQGQEIVTSRRGNFRSGGSGQIISKQIMCQSPSGEAWACCLDDRGKSIQVFSCADGTLRHTLETRDPDQVQMTQVERINIPGRSQFALLGLSLNGFSVYY